MGFLSISGSVCGICGCFRDFHIRMGLKVFGIIPGAFKKASIRFPRIPGRFRDVHDIIERFQGISMDYKELKLS